MTAVSHLSHIIDSLEKKFDSAEKLSKEIFGDTMGASVFHVLQVLPLIYTEVVLSRIIDQSYINTALRAFLLAKVIKNRSSGSVIGPQTDQLICNLMATRVAFPSLEKAFCISSQCQLGFLTFKKAINVGVYMIAANICSWIGEKKSQ